MLDPLGGAFVARPLQVEHVDQAYPLLEIAGSGLDRAHWRAFAHAVMAEATKPCTGIMTVQSARGYIHGLFRFRVAHDREMGRTLFVDDVVAIDILDRGLTVALIEVIETMAREWKCFGVDVALPIVSRKEKEGIDLAESSFRRVGFSRNAQSLRKLVAPLPSDQASL